MSLQLAVVLRCCNNILISTSKLRSKLSRLLLVKVTGSPAPCPAPAPVTLSGGAIDLCLLKHEAGVIQISRYLASVRHWTPVWTQAI